MQHTLLLAEFIWDCSHFLSMIHVITMFFGKWSDISSVGLFITFLATHREGRKRMLNGSNNKNATTLIVPLTFTNWWKVCVHFDLSFNVGGLKPLLDIRNSARIGWRSNMGGWSSASSIAVTPTAQISQSWLYPPFLSTAATCQYTHLG